MNESATQLISNLKSQVTQNKSPSPLLNWCQDKFSWRFDPIIKTTDGFSTPLAHLVIYWLFILKGPQGPVDIKKYTGFATWWYGKNPAGRHTARIRICIKSEQFAPRRASIILSFINTSPAAACFMIIATHLSEAHSAAAWMGCSSHSRTNVLTIELPAHPATLSNFSSGPLARGERRACIREKRFPFERWQRASYCLGPQSSHTGAAGGWKSGGTLDLMHHALIWEKALLWDMAPVCLFYFSSFVVLYKKFLLWS